MIKKILQSDWLKTFWPISHEQKFCQIWDLCRNTTNSINFHYKTNLVKISDQIFQWIQKPYLRSNFASFSQFWGQKFFPENLAVMLNFIQVSSTMPKFRKNQWYNSNAQTDRRMDSSIDWRTDRPYFIGPFQLLPGVQKFRPYEM